MRRKGIYRMRSMGGIIGYKVCILLVNSDFS